MNFSILVEWLPKIQACNFIVKTSHSSQDSTVSIKKSSVLIIVSGVGCLELRFSSVGVELVPDSLSGLSTAGKTIIFRARIKSLNGDIQKQSASATYTISYETNEDIVVLCAVCRHQVCRTFKVSRALPLPSNGEMEFFCHQHSSHQVSLSPGPSDLFYDHLYFLIHADHIEQGGNDAKFKCSNCSTTLGEIKKSTLKIWNSDAFIQTAIVNPNRHICQFLSALFNLTNDVPVQMNKFVFICDRDPGNVTYTLLWILDKCLMLSECDSNCLEVDLDCKIVKKVLYSHHAMLSSEVDDFIKSPTALTISLSPSGEKILLQALKFMSRNIPTEFSVVNGMKVSYLMHDIDTPWDV